MILIAVDILIAIIILATGIIGGLIAYLVRQERQNRLMKEELDTVKTLSFDNMNRLWNVEHEMGIKDARR